MQTDDTQAQPTVSALGFQPPERKLGFSLTPLTDEEHAENTRFDCVHLALKIMIDSKLFENGTVSADDLGPYVCEVADNMFQYITKGVMPDYPEHDANGNVIEKE